MATMKAVVLRRFGPPEVLCMDDAYVKPKPKFGEVLVRIHAAGVNPLDGKIRAGIIPHFLVTFPQILGGDLAGEVVECDPACKRLKVGDKVYGVCDGYAPNKPYGTYAEYIAVSESILEKVPSGLSMELAAGVPLAATTAWQALSPSMPLEGKKVLILAGSGGVGSFAIQIAKAQGAHVTATCSTRNLALVTDTLGADVAIDYTKSKLQEAVGDTKFDVVMDPLDCAQDCLPVLTPRGHYAHIMIGAFSSALVFASWAAGIVVGKARAMLGWGPRYTAVAMQIDVDKGLRQVTELIAAGKVKPLLDRVVPLTQVAEAHTYVDSKRARGKVVLQVAPPSPAK